MSQVLDMTNNEWKALVEMWSTPRHKEQERKGEEMFVIDLFKASHISKKHGFQSELRLLYIGLQSSRKNSSKASVVVAAHMRYLEQKLERSELQYKERKEELATINMKSEETGAAREKEFKLLRKKSQEQDEKLAHLMAFFGSKASHSCSRSTKLCTMSLNHVFDGSLMQICEVAPVK
ncbi:hypothetical protein D1007_58387 [Hordeum vulgare]|nr:hypothetical protein D1007_58387 [Hordeum vulgare]